MRSDRDHMFDEDDEQQRQEQEQRIRDLKKQVEDAAEGDMLTFDYEHPDHPPGVREQFWQNVLQWEKAPWTSEFEQLRKQGVDLPPPEALDDAALSRKLHEIVAAMSKRNVFLEHTDHLSDRELYEHLYHETLHEATKDVPAEADRFCSLDLVGSGSEEDTDTYLKFYADDDERDEYREMYPEGLPAKEARPFDRDRHLPQPTNPPFSDESTFELREEDD